LFLTIVWFLGCRGYVAPEFALHGQLTAKADVFSFGIIVLELVSGRESMKSHLPPEEQYLLLWVSPNAMQSKFSVLPLGDTVSPVKMSLI